MWRLIVATEAAVAAPTYATAAATHERRRTLLRRTVTRWRRHRERAEFTTLSIGLSGGGGSSGGRVVLVMMLFGLIFSNELSVDFP